MLLRFAEATLLPRLMHDLRPAQDLSCTGFVRTGFGLQRLALLEIAPDRRCFGWTAGS